MKTLGKLGDSKAIEPLFEFIRTLEPMYYRWVRKDVTDALKALAGANFPVAGFLLSFLREQVTVLDDDVLARFLDIQSGFSPGPEK